MENDTDWSSLDDVQCPEVDHEGYQLHQSFEFWMEGVTQTVVALLGGIQFILLFFHQIHNNTFFEPILRY